MTFRSDIGRGTYVAHRTFRNGANCDGRAQRRCQRCGGVQYDWGCNFTTRWKRTVWFMNWYCNGRGACGLMETEYMSEAKLDCLRTKPPKVARAPGAPWRRWRQMQKRRA